LKQKYELIEPAEIPLGDRIETNVDCKKRTRYENFQYISVVKTPQLLVKCKEVKSFIETEIASTDNVKRTFKDDEIYKSSEYFQKYPNAIRNTLYYDDLEVCNPLSSRNIIHKIGAFYYTIQNVPSLLNAKRNNCFLLVIAYTKDIKHMDSTRF
jgi:hypothetical protein